MPNCTGFLFYVTKQGDTFALLSLAMYGAEGYAWRIIQANPDHAGTLVFDAGIELTLPIYEDGDEGENLPPWRQVSAS